MLKKLNTLLSGVPMTIISGIFLLISFVLPNPDKPEKFFAIPPRFK